MLGSQTNNMYNMETLSRLNQRNLKLTELSQSLFSKYAITTPKLSKP